MHKVTPYLYCINIIYFYDFFRAWNRNIDNKLGHIFLPFILEIIIEQNTTVVEAITHHHIIHIFIGHKAQLTNIEMAKAVVAINA